MSIKDKIKHQGAEKPVPKQDAPEQKEREAEKNIQELNEKFMKLESSYSALEEKVVKKDQEILSLAGLITELQKENKSNEAKVECVDKVSLHLHKVQSCYMIANMSDEYKNLGCDLVVDHWPDCANINYN